MLDDSNRNVVFIWKYENSIDFVFDFGEIFHPFLDFFKIVFTRAFHINLDKKFNPFQNFVAYVNDCEYDSLVVGNVFFWKSEKQFHLHEPIFKFIALSIVFI